MRGQYRTADGKAQIEWELKDGERGPTFTASGDYEGRGGQCLDGIAKAYPNDERVQQIARAWEQYHLNDMKAGTPEQERAVAVWLRAGNRYDYAQVCEALKEVNLYEVPTTPELKASALGGWDGETYKYGQRWLYSPIPAEVIDEIKSWANDPPRNPLHIDQAAAFLKRNGLQFRAVMKGGKCPPFCDGSCVHGDRYRVTIARKGAGRLSFDFWNSQADMQAGKEPTAYDVLARVSLDAYAPDSFGDFCSAYGYDQDSRKALQTFRRVDKFAQKIRAFFDADELEQLAEIR